MSTLKKLGMAMLIALVFVGCGSKKNTTTAQPQPNEDTSVLEKKNQLQKELMRLEQVDIPCMESSYDDENHYRALGTSRELDMRKARISALGDAKQKIFEKIGKNAESETNFFEAVCIDNNIQGTISSSETNFVFDVVCEKMARDSYGYYLGYVVIQVDKAAIQSINEK